MSSPGLFSSVDQVMKVAQDPAIQKMMYGLGEPKGLTGVGFAPIGPSSILSKKPILKIGRPVRHEGPRPRFAVPA
jgi:TRAP-type C4-dicarboxylate transport system substrate-binding protein